MLYVSAADRKPPSPYFSYSRAPYAPSLPAIVVAWLVDHIEESESQMAGKSTTTVEVEIFGATYHVRGDSDSEYLQDLAAVIDGKMQEVAAQVKTVDRTRIAILAALNVADELAQCKRRLGQGGGSEAIGETISKLTGDLNDALEA